MKKFFLTIFIIVNIITKTMAQNNNITANDLCKEWILEKGWFNQNKIILEKKKNDTTSSKDFISFYIDGKIVIETEVNRIERLGGCVQGIGFLNIEEAKWHSNDDNNIMIEIKGFHTAKDIFHYKIIYNTNIDEDILILKKVKTLITEVKHY